MAIFNSYVKLPEGIWSVWKEPQSFWAGSALIKQRLRGEQVEGTPTYQHQ